MNRKNFWLINYNIVIWWNTTDSLKNEQLLRTDDKTLRCIFKKKKVNGYIACFHLHQRGRGDIQEFAHKYVTYLKSIQKPGNIV